jgi:hypothetical protein
MQFSGHRYIPFHAVSYARRGAEDRVEVHLIDRDLVKVDVREFEQQWAEANSSVVPAPAGYQALSIDRSADQTRIRKTPIIAFRVYEHSRTEPVTLDPLEGRRCEAVQYPDGRVQARRGGLFQDVEHWSNAASRLRRDDEAGAPGSASPT